MDQGVIAGIGNIYADESLWRAGLNPCERVKDIPPRLVAQLYGAIRKTLARGIDFGGDFHVRLPQHPRRAREVSMSTTTRTGKTGTRCRKPGCGGTIVRIVLGGRGTHFCDRTRRC